MPIELTIRDLFILSDGAVVLACDRPEHSANLTGQRAKLLCENRDRQEVTIKGERIMNRQSKNMNQMAIDIAGPLQLTREEAESGNCKIRL